MVQQPSASSQGGVKKASTAAPEQASVVSVSASADDAKPAPTAQAVAANSAGEFAGDKQISSDGADGNTEATVTADGPQEPEVSGAERSGMHTHTHAYCLCASMPAGHQASQACMEKGERVAGISCATRTQSRTRYRSTLIAPLLQPDAVEPAAPIDWPTLVDAKQPAKKKERSADSAVSAAFHSHRLPSFRHRCIALPSHSSGTGEERSPFCVCRAGTSIQGPQCRCFSPRCEEGQGHAAARLCPGREPRYQRAIVVRGESRRRWKQGGGLSSSRERNCPAECRSIRRSRRQHRSSVGAASAQWQQWRRPAAEQQQWHVAQGCGSPWWRQQQQRRCHCNCSRSRGSSLDQRSQQWRRCRGL